MSKVCWLPIVKIATALVATRVRVQCVTLKGRTRQSRAKPRFSTSRIGMTMSSKLSINDNSAYVKDGIRLFKGECRLVGSFSCAIYRVVRNYNLVACRNARMQA